MSLLRASRTVASRALRSAVAPAVPSRAASFWTNVPMGPKDPILGVAENFKVRNMNERFFAGVFVFGTMCNEAFHIISTDHILLEYYCVSFVRDPVPDIFGARIFRSPTFRLGGSISLLQFPESLIFAARGSVSRRSDSSLAHLYHRLQHISPFLFHPPRLLTFPLLL